MKLFELDPNNPIDRELNRASQNATNDGSLDPMDMEDENVPDPSMGGGMDMQNAISSDAEKPVDSAILSAVQGHDYVSKYSHSDRRSQTHPVSIVQMDMDELSQLRNRARGMDARNSISDRVGMYSDENIQAARDLLSFVDAVMAYKKAKVKDDQTASGNRPKVRERQPSKVKAGDRRKAKTS